MLLYSIHKYCHLYIHNVPNHCAYEAGILMVRALWQNLAVAFLVIVLSFASNSLITYRLLRSLITFSSVKITTSSCLIPLYNTLPSSYSTNYYWYYPWLARQSKWASVFFNSSAKPPKSTLLMTVFLAISTKAWILYILM